MKLCCQSSKLRSAQRFRPNTVCEFNKSSRSNLSDIYGLWRDLLEEKISPIKSRAIPPLRNQRFNGTGNPILSSRFLINLGNLFPNASRIHRFSSPFKKFYVSRRCGGKLNQGMIQKRYSRFEPMGHTHAVLYLQ